MEQTRMVAQAHRSTRLVGANWAELTERERGAALAVTRWEGRRAVRASLTIPLVDSADSDDTPFHSYLQALTIACEHYYVEHVIERQCPERAWWWWGSEIAERRADPRVCAFCDSYERERRRILGLTPVPTGIAGLQRFLGEAKEQERESARAWLETLDTSYSSAEYGELQRSAARWEYERSQLCTDLAQMLLAAATYPVRRRLIRERRALSREATTASARRPPGRSRPWC